MAPWLSSDPCLMFVPCPYTAAIQAVLQACQDPLSAWLDGEHGSSVSEHGIFSKLSQHFEKEFFEDMAALNVGDGSIQELPLLLMFGPLGPQTGCFDPCDRVRA
jgi:hypothetical protein